MDVKLGSVIIELTDREAIILNMALSYSLRNTSLSEEENIEFVRLLKSKLASIL